MSKQPTTQWEAVAFISNAYDHLLDDCDIWTDPLEEARMILFFAEQQVRAEASRRVPIRNYLQEMKAIAAGTRRIKALREEMASWPPITAGDDDHFQHDRGDVDHAPTFDAYDNAGVRREDFC